MSVINQMLRDLDARGQGDASRRAALAAVGQASATLAGARRNQRLWWLVAALTLALASTVVMLVSNRWKALEVVNQPSPTPLASASPAASPALLTPPDPASPPTGGDVSPTNDAPPVVAPAPVAPPVVAKPEPAPSERAVAGQPSPVRASVPAARATIERVVPDAEPLDEVRRALSEGRPDAALATLVALGERVAATAERDALEAAALQALGRHAEAETFYRRALRREPDIGAWWAGLGISLEASGRGPEALDAFREAQRRGPLAPALADYLGERVDALSAGESSR